MAKVIQDLHREHINMSRLLDLLEEEVNHLQQEDLTDYDLMLQILDYTACYPELFHHPKEDVIYRKFVELDPAETALIMLLLREHKDGEEMTRKFLNLLKGIAVGDVVPRDYLEKIAREYIRFSRRHIDTEEGRVFPMIERTLRAEDWVAITEDMPSADDPLFGEVVQEPYWDLYERIVGNR